MINILQKFKKKDTVWFVYSFFFEGVRFEGVLGDRGVVEPLEAEEEEETEADLDRRSESTK